MIIKYALAWVPLVIIAIINGSLRQFTYGTVISELAAHQISTLTGISLFAIYIFFVTKIWRIESAKQAITIGLIWLGMTILFEFGFGHFVMGNSWERLFHDYNVFAGRVWILVLIWTTVAPYVFYQFHKN